MVSIEEFRNNALEKFREYLHKNDFKLFLGEEEYWVRFFSMKDPTGTITKHYVAVEFPNNFPYIHPTVLTCPSATFIKESRHQNAINKETLICLWHEYEWDIHTSPEDFHNRLIDWFDRSSKGDWKETDLLADLHLHFKQNYINAITGDKWEDFEFYKFGYSKYIELKKQNTVQGVYLFNPQLGLTKNGQYTTLIQKYSSCNEPILTQFYSGNEDYISTQQDSLWFFLHSEPKPCKTFQELMLQIKKLSGVKKNIIINKIKEIISSTAYNYFILSIIYLDIKNKNQYIHFKINKSDFTFTAFKTNKCDTLSLNIRVEHLKTKLQDKSIAIFGIGAIGSVVADSLGKHGLKSIKLIDHDDIEPANTIRHRLGISSLGLNKAHAMSDCIKEHSLNSTKVFYYDNVYFTPQKIEKIINDVDLVIDCTANKNFSLLLNHICIENQKTCAYIITQKKAAIGQIKIVRPHKDPCLCCYEGNGGIVQNYKAHNYPFVPKGDDDEIVLSCGDATYPAVSSDIEMIAIWGVKIILWLLQNKFEYNHCLIVNDVINDIPDHLSEIGHKFSKFEKVKGCEICDK